MNNEKTLSIIGIAQTTTNTSKGMVDPRLTGALGRLKTEITDVSIDIIKQNMASTVNSILDIFESENFENKKFEVDEIEIALNVGLEGTVSVLSVASGSTNTQSSVVVKIKKKS